VRLQVTCLITLKSTSRKDTLFLVMAQKKLLQKAALSGCA
jgi:hypothetical protein